MKKEKQIKEIGIKITIKEWKKWTKNALNIEEKIEYGEKKTIKHSHIVQNIKYVGEKIE